LYTKRFLGIGFLHDVCVILITERRDWKKSIRYGRYSNGDVSFGTHEKSLDAIVIRSFYRFLVGSRSFIPQGDSERSAGEGLFVVGGEVETRTGSQCHADGTMSEDHLAELRAFVAFLNLESNL
jgi:hypothetical protein